MHCTATHLWVITLPTNLFPQSDFPTANQEPLFHIGFKLFMAERSHSDLDGDTEERESKAKATLSTSAGRHERRFGVCILLSCRKNVRRHALSTQGNPFRFAGAGRDRRPAKSRRLQSLVDTPRRAPYGQKIGALSKVARGKDLRPSCISPTRKQSDSCRC